MLSVRVSSTDDELKLRRCRMIWKIKTCVLKGFTHMSSSGWQAYQELAFGGQSPKGGSSELPMGGT